MTQVYPPETHPSAVMVQELAEHLVEHGFSVTVCAGLPHHPRGRLFPGWKWKAWQSEFKNGVKLLRIGHLVHSSRSIFIRATVYVTQAISVCIAALVSRRCDLVLVYGPPLVGPCLGALVAKMHRAKLVNVIYDIYPDVAEETGKVTNQLVLGAAKIAEKFQYQASDATLVLSEGFRKTLVGKGVAKERIAVIPVWLDPDEIIPADRDNDWRREQGIPIDNFIVLYAGTIGIISGATLVAETANLLRDREDILFLFIGEGDEKPKVEAKAHELNLSNLRFLPFQPRERLREVQATADVGLVTLTAGRGRTSVPSKVLGYLAAGRPVIASVEEDSDTAEEIIATDCGQVVAPGDAKALANAVLSAVNDRDWRERAGQCARARFEQMYAREMVLTRYCEFLKEVVQR